MERILSVDFGGTRIKAAVISDGEILKRKIFPNEKEKSIAEKITEAVGGFQGEGFDGVSFAFPAIVDSKRRKILSTSGKYEDAATFDIVGFIKERFGVDCQMENDAKAALWGEIKQSKTPIENAVLFMVGTGLGTAAVTEGQLLKGKGYQAGCLGGHFKYGGERLCGCGGTGCIETYGGEAGVFKETGKRFKELCEEVRKGDKKSRAVFKKVVKVWAAGIVNLIHAYDPSVVFFGGGVTASKDLFEQELVSLVKKEAWCSGGFPEIRFSTMPDDAALIGAYYLYKERRNAIEL